ncbi:MAG TPA: hypothetical protein DCY85_08245 [Firmicutes bacterium]|nr:hypothetical protein [Bacillota bacterium]HAZ22122.1 hypothetical protein [Bacillota bacterium]HBE06461.1 hypothetical protein [Bacillota bacterium]HBG45342.1 hypothetical protein [Bacillota bacterium]HBL50146.1 hypothetical protein [Bacillota bacterium]
MWVLVLLALISGAALWVGIKNSRIGFAETWKRVVRQPEFYAILAFMAVVLFDVSLTMRLPQWYFVRHGIMDWLLLMAPFMPSLLWLTTLAMRVQPHLPSNGVLLITGLASFAWMGLAIWWLFWTIGFGAVDTFQDFIGILEGILPAVGLPLSWWAVYSKMRRKRVVRT